MRKLISFITITVILLLGVSVTPGAASSPPLDVEIEAPTLFTSEGPSYGTFVATEDRRGKWTVRREPRAKAGRV